MKPIDQSDRLKLIVLAAFAALALLSAASAFGQAATNTPAPLTAMEAARTRTNSLSPSKRMMKERLERVVLPEVSFERLPLQQVIKFFYKEANRRLPSGKSLNFIINSSYFKSGTNNTAATSDLDSVLITISPPLKNVTLATALEAVVQGAERPIQTSLEDYAVVISQKQALSPALYSRLFTVNTNQFIANLARVSGLDTPADLLAFAQKLPPFSATNAPVVELSKALNHFMNGTVGGNASNLTLQTLYNGKLVFLRGTEADLRHASAAILSLDPAATSADWAAVPQGARSASAASIPTPEKDLLPVANATSAPLAAAPALITTSMVTRVYTLGAAGFANRLKHLGIVTNPRGTTNQPANISYALRQLFIRFGAFKNADPVISVIVTNQNLEPLTRAVTAPGPITNKLAREIIAAAGGRLVTNHSAAAQVFFNDRKGLLMIRAPIADFALLEPLIQFVGRATDHDEVSRPPQPEKKANVVVTPPQLPALAQPVSTNALLNRLYQIDAQDRFNELITPTGSKRLAELLRERAQEMVLGYFVRSGVDLRSSEADGKMLLYDNLTGRLLVRGTADELKIIERIIQTLNDSAPPPIRR